MFANRYVAVIDACALVSALGRNTLLSLADAELYRVRWSSEILDETERALATMRQRFQKPSMTADDLLLKYESAGFIQTADVLRPFVGSL